MNSPARARFSPPNPASMGKLPAELRQEAARKALTVVPPALEQRGIYFAGNMPDVDSGENSGAFRISAVQKLQNNFREVLDDTSVVLKSASYAGFTVTHRLEQFAGKDGVPQAVPTELWGQAFPPDRETLMKEAGWLLFCGSTPVDAFEEALTRVSGHTINFLFNEANGKPLPSHEDFATEAVSDLAIQRKLFYNLPEDSRRLDDARRAVGDAYATASATFDPSVSETDAIYERTKSVGIAASEVYADLPPAAQLNWIHLAARWSRRECDLLGAIEEMAKAELCAVAREWQQDGHRYEAENDARPIEDKNPYIASTFGPRARRALAGWPDSAAWDRLSWSREQRAAVDAVAKTGDAAALSAARKAATIEAAVDAIHSIAKSGARSEDEPGVMAARILAGEPASQVWRERQIPEAVRDSFDLLARDYCMMTARLSEPL